MINNYKSRIEKSIDNVNDKLIGNNLIKPTGNLNEKVKKIIVILTSSRAGSSLMKAILAKSNDLAYLSGEEEPYYILTKNAFPWTESDGFSKIKNKQKLLDLIFSDMGINIPFIDVRRTTYDWQKRMLYQYPEMSSERQSQIEEFVHANYGNSNNYEDSTKDFLNNFIKDKRGYYDLFASDKQKFTEDIKIEEPPFVIPSKKRSFTEEDASTIPLLFKTPQDCYRVGIFEQLFPNAEIKYIHLSRGFAQTVNGLMDGWQSHTGFFAHNMESQDLTLNIDDYSNTRDFGTKWWKFDLPPNWKEFTNKPLDEVCLNQWYSAHDSIFDSKVQTMRVKFEDFLINPQETANDICDYVNIPHIEIGVMPVVMQTETPGLYRWKKRENQILDLAKRKDVQNMMYRLGYSMNNLTWL